METKELKKEISRELKELGLKRQDYSLSVKDRGYGDTHIHITVKNPYVNIATVEETLKKYKDISYDLADGEILQGGNTFVIVNYEYGIFNEVSKKYLELSQTKIDEILNNDKTNCIIAYKNKRWCCYLIKDGDMLFASVNDLGRKIINSVKELSELIFRMNQFENDLRY